MKSQDDFLQHIHFDGVDIAEFTDYYKSNESMLEELLSQYGAIKFHGVQIDTPSHFQTVVNSISKEFLRYVDGNSPRTKVVNNVYTSTEYASSQKITMHNELSYSNSWPNKLIFCCLVPPSIDGETLLVDGRKIVKEMNPDIVDEIDNKGVTYIRNLHGGMGMGPSWQDTFETQDKGELEAHCERLGIDFEWRENNYVRLVHKRKGIIRHRQTQEKVWFNQIDQFHPLHLGKQVYEGLKRMYRNPYNFPMFVEFGDGSQISEAMIEEILATIDSITIAPTWNKNEILIVDNELACHGRNSYEGDRRILVSMTN
ncbi:TauD/TfdA family dioxygenase [Aureisphaera galaxeae]|uniref:TauD/TfdA family dioxygenase n=1 Tax=Aureisphaera galaxeae TaxID=1538023 RepID=UPI00234FC0F2|nr:TauD/TfdA family dioxygenase [Aureisphaera galaxeae]MDC8004716.1 TauD/TfdA family dioxygenase [Aureisphaera galaxeae]